MNVNFGVEVFRRFSLDFEVEDLFDHGMPQGPCRSRGSAGATAFFLIRGYVIGGFYRASHAHG
jgi:hypothetical protein